MNRVFRRSAAETAEALLEAGRTEPVLDYDVELGLARHQHWLRNEAPVPEWASGSAQAASTSFVGIVIKTIVSTVLMGALLTAVWQARDLLQPAAAKRKPATPEVVVTQPAVPAATETAAAPMPMPIPLPDQAAAREHVARRPVRVEATDKRATRLHREHKASAHAEPPTSKRATRSEPAAAPASTVSSEEQVSEPVGAAVARTEPAAKSRLVQAPKRQQPEDLVEMQQVATAEQLLERSPARALALVRQGDQRFARGYFQQERAYIAIMALIRLGRTEEARVRAASFSKQFPVLPYGARIRAALDAVARVGTP